MSFISGQELGRRTTVESIRSTLKRPLAVMKTHSSYRNQNLRRNQNDSWSTIVYSIDDDKK